MQALLGKLGRVSRGVLRIQELFALPFIWARVHFQIKQVPSYYSTLHYKWCKTQVTRLDLPNTRHIGLLSVHFKGIQILFESSH